MIITIKINTDTLIGKGLVKELRSYPETVEFVNSKVVSDTLPDRYNSIKDGFEQVSNHILINSETETGKMLLHKLESHRQVVQIEYPYPTDNNGIEIETISGKVSAKQAFQRLGEKYNRKFDNKYTQ